MKHKWRQCRRCAGRIIFVPRQTLCKSCLKVYGLKPYPTYFTTTAGGWVARGSDGKVDSRGQHS